MVTNRKSRNFNIANKQINKWKNKQTKNGKTQLNMNKQTINMLIEKRKTKYQRLKVQCFIIGYDRIII